MAGLNQLKLGRRDKKTLIVISDGGDNASESSRSDVFDLVQKSLATIYTIGLFDADDPDQDPRILKRLARISGGETYFPPNPEAMVPVCRRIAKDIRERYTIRYAPSPGNGVNWHIRVDVSARGHAKLITRTRASYRYDEPGGQRSGQQE